MVYALFAGSTVLYAEVPTINCKITTCRNHKTKAETIMVTIGYADRTKPRSMETIRLMLREMNETQSESLKKSRTSEISLVHTKIIMASTTPVTAESKMNFINMGV